MTDGNTCTCNSPEGLIALYVLVKSPEWLMAIHILVSHPYVWLHYMYWQVTWMTDGNLMYWSVTWMSDYNTCTCKSPEWLTAIHVPVSQLNYLGDRKISQSKSQTLLHYNDFIYIIYFQKNSWNNRHYITFLQIIFALVSLFTKLYFNRFTVQFFCFALSGLHLNLLQLFSEKQKKNTFIWQQHEISGIYRLMGIHVRIDPQQYLHVKKGDQIGQSFKWIRRTWGPWATLLTWETSSNQETHMIDWLDRVLRCIGNIPAILQRKKHIWLYHMTTS